MIHCHFSSFGIDSYNKPMDTLISVVGGLNLDVQATCTNPFVYGDSNPGIIIPTPGGVGRNIAENLVRLGCKVEFISVVGDDPDSEWLIKSCKSIGIGTSGIIRIHKEKCSRYLCFIDSDGTLIGGLAAMDLFDHFDSRIIAKTKKILDSATDIVLDANPSVDAIQNLSEHWRDKLLLYDPVSSAKAGKAGASLGRFSMIKPNRFEAAVLSGVATDTNDGIRKASKKILDSGVKEVYISLEMLGIWWDNGHECGLIAPPVDLPMAVNVSGCGDAASAALVWASVSSAGTREKAACALAAALITAQDKATVSVKINPETIIKLSGGLIDTTLP